MIEMLPRERVEYYGKTNDPDEPVYTAYDLAKDIVEILKTSRDNLDAVARITQHLRKCEFIR